MKTNSTSRRRIAIRATVAVLATALAVVALLWPVSPEATSVLVQGRDVAVVAAAVQAAGGTVTHELGIIDAVAAELSESQIESVGRMAGVKRVVANRGVTTAGKPVKDPSANAIFDSVFPTLIEADRVHAENNLGSDATIAVLDTGVWITDGLTFDYSGSARIDAVSDARTDEWLRVKSGNTKDDNGHGSHITSVAASSLLTDEGLYNGIAPGAGIFTIVAFDAEGNGTYADVIRGIDVAVQNVGWIRVLNLSIGAPVQTHYWDDPLNQAVMRAWQAGLVVVTSVGNTGPDPQTVQVPGNVPYVITVGAMTDNDTPLDLSDDRLASFSSTGPSYEGFVKPEILAPGGHVLGLMPDYATLPQTYPEFYDGGQYFTMSGTSQAAAVVSGVVALMLTADDSLTPDDVKCRLLASARPFTHPDDTLAYSVFQQGAGVINAYDAVHSTATGCANEGMDIDLDLQGVYHYGGRASMDAYGNYFIMGLDGDGYTWDGTFYSTSGYPWSNGYIFTDGYTFTDGYLFTDGTINADGYIWTDGYTFTDGYPWNNGYIFTDGYPFTDAYPFTDTLFEPMSVNVWVPQE